MAYRPAALTEDLWGSWAGRSARLRTSFGFVVSVAVGHKSAKPVCVPSTEQGLACGVCTAHVQGLALFLLLLP